MSKWFSLSTVVSGAIVSSTMLMLFGCAGCEQHGTQDESRRLPRGSWVRASDPSSLVAESRSASPLPPRDVPAEATVSPAPPASPVLSSAAAEEIPHVAVAALTASPRPKLPVEPPAVESPVEPIASVEQSQQQPEREDERTAVKPAATSLLNLVSQVDGQATVERAAALYHEGLRLATKGAWFSARNQFLSALQLLAQINDASKGSTASAQSLALALRAIEESEDFAPRLGQPSDGNALATLIRSHQTPVLKQTPAESLTASVALDRYQHYAQQQLSIACGGSPLGSHILHALGRIYGTLYERRVTSIAQPDEKARTFYTAALSTQPGNYAAANDLGVLEAQSGRLSTARHWLAQSLGVAQQGATLQNLALVEQRLGHPQTLPSTTNSAAPAAAIAAWQGVQWVDPQSFANSTEVASDPRPAVTASRPMTPPFEPRTATRSPDRARWVY